MLEINATSGNTRRRDGGILRIPAGGTPNPVENAVSVPETDPERIAFNLWNEGKVDEAIQFLEREIANRRDRDEAGEVAAGEIKPVSDWRDRHRSLGSADFNAFGSSARTIDLVAGPADAIVPHPPRRKMRPVWIMGICLAVIGISSAAALWSSRAGAPEETSLAAVEPTLVKSEPAATAPVPAPKPKPYIAAVDADTDATADIKPVPGSAAADTAQDVDAGLPPEDEAVASDAASDANEPETTASIGSAPAAVDTPAAEEPAPVVEARLPRQRPEPPAHTTRVAHVDQRDPPIVYAPPSNSNAQANYDPPSGDTPPRYFDPNNPPPRLTPAEYRALIERRAWAENYVSRRRAYAERRARIEDEYPGALEPFIRSNED